ncbi:MAG: phospho-sugar mutase, partial [Verrucomicrobia bacterium]
MTASQDLITIARTWLAEDPDPTTRAELQAILDAGDMSELGERFGTRLEFGTAGLRGVIGAGPNRMNRSLVRRVTAGLARYLLAEARDAAGRGVVVGYDGRRMSREFAEDTASVLAGAGIRVHRFQDVATTPLTAYAVTALDAAAGIVVTASHNPPEYNGYKVYWENGAQIIPPHDAGISKAIDRVGTLDSIDRVEPDDARAAELVLPVPDSVGEDYFRSVLDLQLHTDTPREFPIVYTPLHGVGGASVAEVFSRAGYTGFQIVPQQAEPDGEFPTVNFPNPEEPGAMDLARDLAATAGADLILANDPDADRLAVVVRDTDGALQPLTGNQIGTLLAHYLLTQGDTGGDRLVCTTIVSSGILHAMADKFGVAYG